MVYIYHVYENCDEGVLGKIKHLFGFASPSIDFTNPTYLLRRSVTCLISNINKATKETPEI